MKQVNHFTNTTNPVRLYFFAEVISRSSAESELYHSDSVVLSGSAVQCSRWLSVSSPCPDLSAGTMQQITDISVVESLSKTVPVIDCSDLKNTGPVKHHPFRDLNVFDRVSHALARAMRRPDIL